MDTFLGANIIAQLLKEQEKIQDQSRYLYIVYQTMLLKGNLYQNFITIVLSQIFNNSNIKKLMANYFLKKYIISFIVEKTKYPSFYLLQMIPWAKINYSNLKTLYEDYQYEIEVFGRKSTYTQLYKQYILSKNKAYVKYFIYQLLLSIRNFDDALFTKKFNINTINSVKAFLQLVKQQQVDNFQDLQTKINIMECIEYSDLTINNANQIIRERFSGDLLDSLFGNIRNRILCVNASDNFILIKSKLNDIILKGQNVQEIDSKLENIRQTFNYQHIYDAIIYTTQQFNSIGNQRLQFLNYRNWSHTIQISLQFPKDIINVTLYHVKIQNLNKCSNLINIHSEWNEYNDLDIRSLRKLQRVHSIQDKYLNSKSTFLEDIFKNNKLIYIHIYNWSSDSNIIGDIRLNKTILLLQYVFIQNVQIQCDIILDITNEFPYKLHVFSVLAGNRNGRIEGQKKQYIESNLIK